MGSGTVMFAFAVTSLAGLSTGIGSALAFFTKRTNTRFLSVALGFSAGVMLYVSFIEILTNSRERLTLTMGGSRATWVATLSFFGGIAFIALVDWLVPSSENPHEVRRIEELADRPVRDGALLRMGLLSALAIAIHNFPEGVATFTAGLQDRTLGTGIAVAIAIHNIPEGIAVSVPVYYATGDRNRAFGLSFASGLAEPLGALLGYLILFPFLGDVLLGVLFAAVAGIMVFISVEELLPTAEKYGEHHLSILGLVAGMAVMAFSLLLTA
jgi:ZIP family zinc transporter